MSPTEEDSRKEDGREEGDRPDSVAIKIDAAHFQRNLERTARALEGIQKAAQQATEFQRSVASAAAHQQGLAEAMQAVTQAAVPVSKILDQNYEVWTSIHQRMGEIAETVRPVLEAHADVARALDASAVRMVRTFAETRLDLRPLVEAAVAANAAVADAGAVTGRVLDEVSRAPEPSEATDALNLLVERLASAIAELDASPAVQLSLLSILLTLFTAWCTTVQHEEIQKQIQTGNQQTQEYVEDQMTGVQEQIDALAEEVQSDEVESDSACGG